MKPIAQSFTGKKLHNKVVLPLRFTHVIHSNDVLVADIAGNQTFAKKAFPCRGAVHQCRIDQLQGDLASRQFVDGEVHDTHGALSEFPFDLVAPVKFLPRFKIGGGIGPVRREDS